MERPDLAATMQILAAHTENRLPAVTELFREYARAIEIDLCFQGFEAELASLPGRYAPPAGRLFLAQEDGEVAGCVALRKIDDGICEMKRLYVRPPFRRHGTGRLLASAVIEAAQECGYRAMRLDTLSSMREAITLYESLGFQRIEPYYANPSGCALFFELKLAPNAPATNPIMTQFAP